MKPVLTKQDFVRRFQRGEFGNRTRVWDSLEQMSEEAVLEQCSDGAKFHIRNRITGGPTWYNVAVEDLADTWYSQSDRSKLYIAEMAPHHLGTIQGEVCRPSGENSSYVDTLYLRMSMIKKPMREALEEDQIHLYGVVAKYLLIEYLPPEDYDWIMELLDNYEDHTVEFSSFSKKLGTLNRNTIIWEVRRY